MLNITNKNEIQKDPIDNFNMQILSDQKEWGKNSNKQTLNNLKIETPVIRSSRSQT